MTAADWKAATGLPYLSVLNNQQSQPHQQQASQEQQRLDELNALQRQLEEQQDLEAEEAADVKHTPSLIEQALGQHVGPDVVQSLTQGVAETGELDPDLAAKHGIEPFMVEEATEHYLDLADQALMAVNGATAHMQELLNESEQARARKALVSEDLATFRTLGERARERAASMDAKTSRSFFSTGELVRLNVRDRGNGTLTVTLPGIGETSLSNAIVQG